MSVVLKVEAKIQGASAPKILINQQAQHLKIFVERGSRGITKAELCGGLHLGDIVMKLRRKGFSIVTHMEPNTGPYGGEHGRYELIDKVEITELEIPPCRKTKRLARFQPTQVSIPNSNTGRAGGSDEK